MSILQRLFDIDSTTRDDFWEGAPLRWSKLLSTIYLIVTLGSLAVFLLCAPIGGTPLSIHDQPPCVRLGLLLLSMFVSIAPPAWFWLEARAFDVWVNRKFQNRTDQIALRDTYRINADFAKNFWAGIIAVYAAVLLRW